MTFSTPSSLRCISAGILFADIACWPIDHLPQEGELVATERIALSLGGNAANIAMNLTRLGIPVALAGCVGDDALSDFIIRSVSRPGIDTTGVQRINDACPGTAMHLNVTGQDRRYICTTGANDRFRIDGHLERLVATPNPAGLPRVLSLSGFLMHADLENERTPDFLKLARSHGWFVLLDVVLNGSRPYWEAIRPLLPHTDLFLPNDHEAEQMTGLVEPERQADFFLGHGVASVAITQGAEGTFYAASERLGGKRLHTPIFPMPFISGAGSGDAFAAGFIAAILESLPIEECLRWGSALGASAVRGLGTTETVFNRAELTAFLAAPAG